MSTLVERLRKADAGDLMDMLPEVIAALRATTGEGEAVAWPDHLVNLPCDDSGDRIIGFRVPDGDPILGKYGLSEPLAWLRSVTIDRAAAPPPPLRDAGAVLERGTRVTVVRGAHRGRSGVIHEVDGHAANVCLDGIYGPKRFAIVDLSWRTHPAPAQVDEGAVLEIVARYVGITSNVYRYIQRDLAALTAAAKEVSGG